MFYCLGYREEGETVSALSCREGDAEENLGSPGDPGFSLACWSLSGKYLAGALEKMVNIWQVNGTNSHHF